MASTRLVKAMRAGVKESDNGDVDFFYQHRHEQDTDFENNHESMVIKGSVRLHSILDCKQH